MMRSRETRARRRRRRTSNATAHAIATRTHCDCSSAFSLVTPHARHSRARWQRRAGSTRHTAMKVAIYARYSSDNQRDASIADQLRICREYAARQGWIVAQEFTDHAVSGATLLRAGFQSLMRDALERALRRRARGGAGPFSRDQEDTAGLFKRLTFAGVNIVTLAEGDITHLHVGLKGTMNALFLKDLADKTRRGLRGRVELGKSGGGLCYGYKVTRATNDGEVTTGDREIVPTEAEVIRRIFRDYAAGVSPKALARRLNAEHVRARWHVMESEHHSRESGARHGNPEQRAVYRPACVEPTALRQGPGYRQTRFAAESTVGVGDDRRSSPAYRGRRAVGPGEGAASRDASRDVERRSETVQPGAAPEVPLLWANEVCRVRWRVRHLLARPPGVLRRALARHVHQPPDRSAARRWKSGSSWHSATS